MTIDYCENRLDGIIEAGGWLIDLAVEDAIARNDWTPPAAPKPAWGRALVQSPGYLAQQIARNDLFNSLCSQQIQAQQSPLGLNGLLNQQGSWSQARPVNGLDWLSGAFGGFR